MSLPIRTTLDDIRKICDFLATKPTGATIADAKAVIGERYLDGRKVSAFRFWRLLEEDDHKLKLTTLGKKAVKALSPALRAVIEDIKPYKAVIEKAAHSDEDSETAIEVASYWHSYFRHEVSDSDRILNDQAVCFFQLIEGAELGQLVIGRRGSPTRIDFNREEVESFIKGESQRSRAFEPEPEQDSYQTPGFELKPNEEEEPKLENKEKTLNDRVFITHGKNTRVLEQIREIVRFGKLEPVVAQEHESTSKPVPEKVLEDMRSCDAGIIHVESEQDLQDKEGTLYPKINENVLIEIGAAMALYQDNFILLVEEGIELPSNLQGLYQCRYSGDKLDGDATMKLLKAFNEFK